MYINKTEIIKRLLFFMVILNLTVACKKEEVQIQDYCNCFTNPEVEELDLLVSKFDSLLLTKYSEQNVSRAYLMFSDSIFYYAYEQNILEDFKSLNSIYSKILTFQVAKKIWSRSFMENWKIFYNSENLYNSYLHELGKKNDVIYEYWETINALDDIPPSLILFISKNAEKLNFNDRNHRLMLAVHYLTLYNREVVE